MQDRERCTGREGEKRVGEWVGCAPGGVGGRIDPPLSSTSALSLGKAKSLPMVDQDLQLVGASGDKDPLGTVRELLSEFRDEIAATGSNHTLENNRVPIRPLSPGGKQHRARI